MLESIFDRYGLRVVLDTNEQ